ncbi:MAG: hypothetical protein KatS3mg035_1065 [Bacteroidia bacterium]|nr:MAG: hypothetical protein KatS3mg035_1065 [Bacteroidia bacterium]
MQKSEFAKNASNYGVSTHYSGSEKTMYISGDDKKVKSFIRVCCLKGKGAFRFSIKQK